MLLLGDMHTGKAMIRNHMRSMRQDVALADLTARSLLISKLLEHAIDWRAIKTLHAYLPIERLREVATEPLLAYLVGQYPHIAIATAPLENDSSKSLWLGAHSRPLPRLLASDLVPDGQQFDCIIVPVLAFDAAGYRLGWGGGWYDRFLAAQPQALKIGLAYQMSLLPDGLPPERHDIPLDMVITETTVYRDFAPRSA